MIAFTIGYTIAILTARLSNIDEEYNTADVIRRIEEYVIQNKRWPTGWPELEMEDYYMQSTSVDWDIDILDAGRYDIMQSIQPKTRYYMTYPYAEDQLQSLYDKVCEIRKEIEINKSNQQIQRTADVRTLERHIVNSEPSAEVAIVSENLLAYGTNGSHSMKSMSSNDGWSIKSFAEKDGEVGPWGVVATSSGVAYVSSAPGYAHVLLRQMDDGTVIWKARLAERGINYIRELVYCRNTAKIIAVGDGNMPQWHSVLFSIDEDTGQFKQVDIPGKGILDACLLSDGRVAISGSECVGIYDPADNSFVSLSVSLGYSWAVAQFDEARIVVSSGSSIKSINILSKVVEWSIPVSHGLIQALTTLPDGTIVAGGIPGHLHYIQIDKGKPCKVISLHSGGYIRDIEYDQKKGRLYIASSTGVSYYTRQASNKALHTDARSSRR